MSEFDDMSEEQLRAAVRLLMRTHLYVGGERWNEGHWFYRDHESGKLYSVPGFSKGLAILVFGFEHGPQLVGVAGDRDTKERPHAIGTEVITILDRMGDFESAAERYQGRRLP